MAEAAQALDTQTDANLCSHTQEVKQAGGSLASGLASIVTTVMPDRAGYFRTMPDAELFPIGERAAKNLKDDAPALNEIRQRFKSANGQPLMGYTGWLDFVAKNFDIGARQIQKRLAGINGKDATKVNTVTGNMHTRKPVEPVAPTSHRVPVPNGAALRPDQRISRPYVSTVDDTPAPVAEVVEVVAGEMIGSIKVWEDVTGSVEATDGSRVWIIEKLETGKAELWRGCDVRRLKRGLRPKLTMGETAYSTHYESRYPNKEWGIAYWKGRTEWAQLRLVELKGGEPAPSVDDFTPPEPVASPFQELIEKQAPASADEPYCECMVDGKSMAALHSQLGSCTWSEKKADLALIAQCLEACAERLSDFGCYDWEDQLDSLAKEIDKKVALTERIDIAFVNGKTRDSRVIGSLTRDRRNSNEMRAALARGDKTYDGKLIKGTADEPYVERFSRAEVMAEITGLGLGHETKQETDSTNTTKPVTSSQLRRIEYRAQHPEAAAWSNAKVNRAIQEAL